MPPTIYVLVMASSYLYPRWGVLACMTTSLNFHTRTGLLLLGCFISEVWAIFLPQTPLIVKNSVWLRTPDLLLDSVCSEAILCTRHVQCSTVLILYHSLVCCNYSKWNNPTKWHTAFRDQYRCCEPKALLTILKFCCRCTRVLSSPAIIPSLHSALKCLKAFRFWLLRHSSFWGQRQQILGKRMQLQRAWASVLCDLLLSLNSSG